MDIEKEHFHGMSDGMPDCVLIVRNEDGVRYLEIREDCDYTTLKLDSDAIEYLKKVIELCSE